MAAVVTFVLAGCAGDRELAILRNDMERMNRQLLQLQVSQEVGQSKPREFIEGERRNIADMKAGFDELKQQLSILTERMEASDTQMNRRLGALEGRLSQGSSTASMVNRPSPATSGQSPGELPTASQSTDPSSSAEAKRLYQAALSDYQRGKFDLAVQGFRTYLEQAPHGDVADTAQYYLGESLYSGKDYRGAIAEFERLVRDFPQSPQVPSALLKTGYAYYEVKDGVQGRRVLRTLVEKYPTSREAKLAEERLRLEDRAGASRLPPGTAPPSR